MIGQTYDEFKGRVDFSATDKTCGCCGCDWGAMNDTFFLPCKLCDYCEPMIAEESWHDYDDRLERIDRQIAERKEFVQGIKKARGDLS